MSEGPGHLRPKKVVRGKDSAGHEFAGDVGLTERIAPPRPAPAAPARPAGPPPRPPHPKGPAPDPSIAGSKYFTPGHKSEPPPARTMTSVRRERSTDSDALDSTIEDDLGEVARRRDRERATQASADNEENAAPTSPTGSGSHKDLDAEAGPRELDFSAPDMPRKRRNSGPF